VGCVLQVLSNGFIVNVHIVHRLPLPSLKCKHVEIEQRA
jgi:hypothetical protein